MSIEAMKQALEALERSMPTIPHMPSHRAAITSLRQAIEQAERFDKQPTKILSTEEVLNSAGFYKAEKQEPVAHPTEDMVLALRGASGLGTEDAIDALRDVLAVMPLYTAPQPQREWVGLTQEDIDIAFDDTQEGGGFNEFVKAIEQILRRKNT